MKNLRFCIYWNGGYVKLVLRPGQTVELSARCPTDEGYSFRQETYTYAPDGTLVCDVYSGGKDCDGFCSYSSTASADKFYTNDLGYRVPQWEVESRSQYDQYAELAGY